MKIVTVIGARPQFIKAAAVSRILRRSCEEILIHTGQHYDPELSDVFFSELEIPQPDHHLGIALPQAGAAIAAMLQRIEELLLEIKPQLVLLYGDTHSTFASAVAAATLKIPIAHVEAGPRIFNHQQPEEINRVFTDYVSSLRFCPTLQSVKNLQTEQMNDNVFHVGDVMYDTAIWAKNKAESCSHILSKLNLAKGQYMVATIHRAEHTDSAEILTRIFKYLQKQPLPVVLPLHPRTRSALERFQIKTDNIHLIAPLGYLDMTALVAAAAHIITDSGGLPKEAYFHRVLCTTIGKATPWPETISAGWNRLWSQEDWIKPQKNIEDYGDGHAAEKIVEHIKHYLLRQH